MQIIPISAELYLDAVTGLFAQAADYMELAEGREPDRQMAVDFFQDAPPNGAADDVIRVGLFMGEALCGLADLSFGFPDEDASYIGLMLIAPARRNGGLGRDLLNHMEALARARGARQLYIGVLNVNPKGRAFWEREGFSDTGVTAFHEAAGQRLTLHRFCKQL